MSDDNVPQVGSVVELPANVKAIWKHVTIVVAALMASITAILAALIQLHQLPFLPTNVLAWIGVAIVVLNTIVQVYQKLNGTPAVTPTAAAKFSETK